MDAKQSQRNIFAAAAAAGIGATGFTLVMPFLPLYIVELGTTDLSEIAMWSGLTLAATPAVTAISAPMWGRVGDRYGSKVLVMRSIAAFILTKAAMAFVTAPWQLLALRALLGVFAGYGALTISMAAESAPRDRMAHAIGIVQTGQRLGPAIGPVIGGALAPLVGLRNAFLVAAAFYTLALFIVVFIYREPREGRAPRVLRGGREVFSQLFHLPGFVLALVLIFGLQTVDRSFGPVLPLYVAQVGIESARVPFVSGVLFSLAAIAAAFGAFLAGRLLRRFSAKRVIVVNTLAAAVGMAAVVIAPSLWIVGAAMMIIGAAIGTATTTVWAIAGSLLPADAHATGFGLMTTANLIGLAFSPFIAGFIGGSGLRIVFIADVILLLMLGALVARKLRSDALRSAPDAPIPES